MEGRNFFLKKTTIGTASLLERNHRPAGFPNPTDGSGEDLNPKFQHYFSVPLQEIIILLKDKHTEKEPHAHPTVDSKYDKTQR